LHYYHVTILQLITRWHAYAIPKGALSRAERRAREELRVKGVAARTKEREMKKKLKALEEQGKTIPPSS
jgi:hypothetical protein